MKKIISTILICTLMCLTLVGCGEKTALTTEGFKSQMEDMGYTIIDCAEQFADYDYIEACYVAVEDEEMKYQIEWYDLEDVDTAVAFFNNQKEIFEYSKGNSSSSSSSSIANNSKYTLNANGTFKLLSRIDDTVIYVDCDNTYKDMVKEIVEKLNY